MTLHEFERHLDEIAGAPTIKKLKAAVESVMTAHGFGRWIYATDNPYGKKGIPVTLSNGFGVWLLTYMAKGYESFDPIVAHCRATEEPLLWDSQNGLCGTSAKEQSLMRDLVSQGFRSGMAIPLHLQAGPRGLINVVRSGPLVEELAHFEEMLPRIRRVGQIMHETMTMIMKVSAKSRG